MLKGVSLFAQSDEPLFDGTLSGKMPSSKSQSPYRAGKEALAAQRGAILVPTTGERPLRSLWNRLLGRKETLTNGPTNGPPTVRANGDNIDIPLADSVVRREPHAPTLNAMVGNDMGFENGRPMSGNNPNLLRGPPNQFKDFLENQNQNNTVQLINPVSPSSQTKSRFGPINSTLQNRQNALLNGSPGVNITPRSSALKYERIGSGNRTFLTDIQAVETIIGPLTKERIKITKTQARVLERELGLNRNYLESRNIIYIVNEINNRAPASPIRGNNYFQGAGKGLPGGGPELTINGIPSVGSQNIRQIILEVD